MRKRPKATVMGKAAPVTGVVVLALLLASCGGSGVKLVDPAADSTRPAAVSTTPPAAASQSPTPTAEKLAQQQVLAVYRGFWHAVSTTVPQSETVSYLSQYMAPPALTSTAAFTSDRVRRGQVTWGESDIPLQQTMVVTGNTAVVTGCVDSSKGGLAEAATGRRFTVGVPRNSVQVTETKTTTGWRVTFVKSLLNTPAGKAACA